MGSISGWDRDNFLCHPFRTTPKFKQPRIQWILKLLSPRIKLSESIASHSVSSAVYWSEFGFISTFPFPQSSQAYDRIMPRIKS